MVCPGNDGEARYKKQGFQVKLLLDVLRINPDVEEECARGYLCMLPVSHVLPVQGNSDISHQIYLLGIVSLKPSCL